MTPYENPLEDEDDCRQSHDGFEVAQRNLKEEFQICFADVPDSHSMAEEFLGLTQALRLSTGAQTSILYRIVASRIASVLCREKRNNGSQPDFNSIKLVIALVDASVVDASVDWSETAHDSFLLEGITSSMNRNLESTISELGIRRTPERRRRSIIPKIA